MDFGFEAFASFLEVFELVVAGSGGREQADFAFCSVMDAVIDNFGEIVFDDKRLWQRIFRFPLAFDALAGGTREDDMRNGVLVKIVNQDIVADAAVEAPDNEGIDFAKRFDCRDGCFGNGGDAVVVKFDTIISAHQFDAMLQTLKSGQIVEDILIADAELLHGKNGGHDVVVVVPSRQVVVAVQVVFAQHLTFVHTHHRVINAIATGVDGMLTAEFEKFALVVVALDEIWNMLILSVINQNIGLFLLIGDVHLGQLVVAERGKMVEMLLIDVEQNGDMRGNGGVFKLVCRQFCHDDRIIIQLVHNIEEGYADIACQKGVSTAIGQDVVNQRGSGTFALGACNSDYLVIISVQEQFCL